MGNVQGQEADEGIVTVVSAPPTGSATSDEASSATPATSALGQALQKLRLVSKDVPRAPPASESPHKDLGLWPFILPPEEGGGLSLLAGQLQREAAAHRQWSAERLRVLERKQAAILSMAAGAEAKAGAAVAAVGRSSQAARAVNARLQEVPRLRERVRVLLERLQAATDDVAHCRALLDSRAPAAPPQPAPTVGAAATAEPSAGAVG